MPENEKTANIHWLVRVAGCDEELLVRAAYVVYHSATEPATVHSIGDRHEPVIATFKNADHKIVFQVQAVAMVYVRHADATARVDQNVTPNQLRDLKDELGEAAEGHPLQPFTHITASPGVSVAAGGAQTWAVSVPTS